MKWPDIKDHFDFLASCANQSFAPQLCQSTPHFHQRAFHDHFNAEVVRLLKRAPHARVQRTNHQPTIIAVIGIQPSK